MIFIPTMRVDAGTPCVDKTGEGTLYSTDFEGVIKNTYGAATVELGGFPWLLDDTLLGTATGDIKNGARSARIRDGKIEMQWTAAQGIKTFSFLASRSNFSGDRSGTSPILSVQKSTDNGANWTTVGTVNLAGINSLTSYSFLVNEDAACRMRIIKTGGDVLKRCNVDDLTIVEKRYGCIEIPCEPPPSCLGRNWNSTWRLRGYDGYSLNTGSIQSWSLKFPDGQVYTSTDTPKNIPDGGSNSSYITVTGQPTTGIRWDDIKFSCNIQHPYKGDIWLTLTPYETGHFWNPAALTPCTNCEVALIHQETGGSADNIIYNQVGLNTFRHTITEGLSSNGLPILDQVTNQLLCGPAPSVDFGQLISGQASFTTVLSSANNWIKSYRTAQDLSLSVPNPYAPFSRKANFNRYLGILVTASTGSVPINIIFEGVSVNCIPGQYAYVLCPYQQSDYDGTGFFGPEEIPNDWIIEALRKEGAISVSWRVDVFGYPA